MKVYLVDFEDSFTLNIFCEMSALGMDVEVVACAEASDFLEANVNTKEKLALVLGPGPGHPDEYSWAVESLKKLLRRDNIFILGICLGHQLVARALGLEVCRSSRPCHGQVEVFDIGDSMASYLGLNATVVEVQRYNSLAVPIQINLESIARLGLEVVSFREEAQIIKGERFLTYQFHPESVGTSFRPRFFNPLRTFLL